jgi:hypothetical protein
MNGKKIKIVPEPPTNIKVGDKVRFNRVAHLTIPTAVDKREYVVEAVVGRPEKNDFVKFVEGSGSDICWLEKV